MNREELKRRESESFVSAKKSVSRIIEVNPSLSALEYSLGWAIFSLYMSDSLYVTKKERAGFHIRTGYPQSKYFLSFGNIPESLAKIFGREGIREFRVKLSKKTAGMTTDRGLLFSQRYKKSNIGYIKTSQKDADIVAERVSADHFDDLKRFREELRRIFLKRLPEFVILDEDRTKYKRALAEEAFKLKIKTFVIQHGITMEHSKADIPFADDSFAPLNADFFLCWGGKSLKYMEEFPGHKGRIIQAGASNLSFDFSERRIVRDIVIIDQQFQSVEEERPFAYEKLIGMLEKIKADYAVYLRMSHNRDYLVKLTGGKVIDWRRGGVVEEMRKSRMTLGFTSTALIESLYQGVPALSYDYMGSGDVLGLGRGVISSIQSLDEIEERIRSEAGRRRDRDEFVSAVRYHISFDGREAAEKTAAEVLKKR